LNKYPYGLIGNCVSTALVSKEGSVDWMCMPYFDSPSVFAKILDSKKGGSFAVEGVDVVKTSQEYLRFTPILRTRVETKDGVFDMYDYMPRFQRDADHLYCPAEIQRSLRVISGQPRIRVRLDVRPNYGLSQTRVEDHGDFLKYLSVDGEYHSFYLYTDLKYADILESREITLPTSAYLILSYHEKIQPVHADRIYVEFERTKSYWLGWTYRTKVPDKYRNLIVRSLIVLKLLMYERTGAVIAAPTTSLPETMGGPRNWDYRYCWSRDASMIVELYARLGHVHSSSRYMRFILNRMLLKNDGVAVMYGIHGDKILTEKTLDHLDGYADSKPVRIGNEAYLQTQNDLYGELLDAIFTYFELHADRRFDFDQELWTAVRSLVNASKKVWEQPDNGIWEYRGGVQHHVFSKLMNWVAMDRAGRIARIIDKQSYADDCFKLAAKIKEDILTKGWNEKVQAFTMSYGSMNADAAVLQMLHYGFLPKDDPRMVKTVDFCYRELVKNGFAMRYTADDDFGKPENAFLICTFWMVNALHLTGRREEAREMFNRAVGSVNYLGLMSEGLEPETGRQTGNFPQGYSHMAFIQSALLLETDYRWGPTTDAGHDPDPR
jgi:GH15 family glucan-1,4-alpha-glucosidase